MIDPVDTWRRWKCCVKRSRKMILIIRNILEKSGRDSLFYQIHGLILFLTHYTRNTLQVQLWFMLGVRFYGEKFRDFYKSSRSTSITTFEFITYNTPGHFLRLSIILINACSIVLVVLLFCV
jgi:hypothetical protein